MVIATKSAMDQAIDGDHGPKMTGVTTYPYSQAQKLYIEDFRALVAGSIDHPFNPAALAQPAPAAALAE